MIDRNQQQYDAQKKARAGTRAILRTVVALYLIYLGYNILKGTVHGESSLPLWLGYLAGIVFIAAALGFGVYIYRRWRMDLEAAILSDTEETSLEIPDTDLPAEDTEEEL